MEAYDQYVKESSLPTGGRSVCHLGRRRSAGESESSTCFPQHFGMMRRS